MRCRKSVAKYKYIKSIYYTKILSVSRGQIMHEKIVKAVKRGGSIMIPLTDYIKEGDHYIVEKKDNQIVLTKVL